MTKIRFLSRPLIAAPAELLSLSPRTSPVDLVDHTGLFHASLTDLTKYGRPNTLAHFPLEAPDIVMLYNIEIYNLPVYNKQHE